MSELGTRLELAGQDRAAATRARELAQSQPRPARVRFSAQTLGVGETRLQGKTALDFGVLMLEEPTFTFGVASIEARLNAGELPLATACVISYIRSKSGLWVGANLGFRVESGRTKIRLKFSLTFEGSALRSSGVTQGQTPAERGANVSRAQPIDPSAL